MLLLCFVTWIRFLLHFRKLLVRDLYQWNQRKIFLNICMYDEHISMQLIFIYILEFYMYKYANAYIHDIYIYWNFICINMHIFMNSIYIYANIYINIYDLRVNFKQILFDHDWIWLNKYMIINNINTWLSLFQYFNIVFKLF